MTETLTPETSQAELAQETAQESASAQHSGGASAHSSEEAHGHPSDWQYIKIALLLAVLTAIEVFTYFESVHNLSDAALYLVLTVLMVLKFAYVAAWFMHLKFDSLLFRRVFQVGITLALGVYIAMLTVFEIW